MTNRSSGSCGGREFLRGPTVEPKHICIREFPALFHASWYKTAVRDVGHVECGSRDLYGLERRGRA
jgi:hypothetical protein